MRHLDNELLQKIATWKAKWGNVHIIELEDSTQTVRPWIYRSLTGLELLSLREIMTKAPSGADWEMVIVETCLLEPASDKMLPGTASALAEEIRKRSEPDIDQLTEDIKELRSWAKDSAGGSFTLSLCLRIVSVFPSIDLLSLLSESSDRILQIAGLVELATDQKVFTDKPQAQTAKQSSRTDPTLPTPPISPQQEEGMDTSSNSLRAEIERAREERRRQNQGNK